MEPSLALLGIGGGGSSGASNDEFLVSEAEAVENHQTDFSSEESSCDVEAELELGLGLSLGSGVSVGKGKHGGWGERGRILTAKDFPSAISPGGSSSSVRFSGRGAAVSGVKRAAEPVSHDGGSPPPAVSQVVGWPPIRAYRINSLVNQAKNQRAGDEKELFSLKNRSNGVSEKIHDGKNTSATDTEKGPLGFVKVYMDGVLIGRKVDLNAHSCYETLALMLEDMFFKSAGSVPSTGLSRGHDKQAPKLSKLLTGSSEFGLTYEDKEGDWLLVGDVPWRMFLGSVKKLRIMRTSEAKGLGNLEWRDIYKWSLFHCGGKDQKPGFSVPATTSYNTNFPIRTRLKLTTMYWAATRNVVSLPRWRFLALLIGLPPRNFTSFTHSPSFLERQRLEKLQFGKGRKYSGGSIKAAKKFKDINNVQDDKFLSHILWWKETVASCNKPSSVQLVKRLDFSNLLGLDINLKNGSLKEGTLNWEILQFKAKFPREVLLCRVGDFYEAIGFDACILVEYAGLNPFGGQRMDSIPKAGCPVVNLRQTLDDLTRNGFSVCIVEEVQGPMQARSRKGRFISGHAHPGSPYVFGLVGVDHDLDFPEPMPVVGISRSARGYCISLVTETMKTFSSEDGLTEEALVTKLRTCQYHHLFLHTSLRNNSSGTCRWGEFGEGGRLWGECNSRHFEWFDGNPLTNLLSKVKELYGLDDEVTFRNVTISSENRPHPLTLGTATQIGAIPTEGIPCLLKVLLPSNCAGLPALYIRDLLLNPPAHEIATTIQASCRLMSNVTCAIPDFTCFPPAKLVKLLEMREANHIEFCRMKNVLDEILHMHRNPELNNILKLLMDPTYVATGLKIDFDTFVNECEWASSRVGEIIFLDGERESDQKISSYSIIPNDFFEDMESSWKGRVKRIHIEEACTEVERAAEALSLAVTEDFVPIISRIKAITAPLGGPKGEILYAREHQSVWFKGRRFAPAVWAGSPGEEEIKQLKPALDSKGKKVGEEWFTTKKVEDALTRYQEANTKAKARVVELLRQLSSELLAKINVLIFASMLLILAKALFAHVSEGRRRKWVFPTLAAPNDRSKKWWRDLQEKEPVGLRCHFHESGY